MTPHHPLSTLFGLIAFAIVLICVPIAVVAQAPTAGRPSPHPRAVLVELFTSEGCSSCPPADELLRQISGRRIPDGQLVVGLSEHVSYWNGLGWNDPFSSELYTGRQNDYGTHFGLKSVYTPQIVVNGREQFLGNDRRALQVAFLSEAQRPQIDLHITSAQITGKNIIFSYSASELPANSSLQLVAVLVDDMDRSHVLRGENSGRELIHVAVARAFAPLGALQATEKRSISLPLPSLFTAGTGTGHHLVLFAQQNRAGAVMGIDTKSL